MCMLQLYPKEKAHFRVKEKKRETGSSREKQSKMETELGNDMGGGGNEDGVQGISLSLA